MCGLIFLIKTLFVNIFAPITNINFMICITKCLYLILYRRMRTILSHIRQHFGFFYNLYVRFGLLCSFKIDYRRTSNCTRSLFCLFMPYRLNLISWRFCLWNKKYIQLFNPYSSYCYIRINKWAGLTCDDWYLGSTCLQTSVHYYRFT